MGKAQKVSQRIIAAISAMALVVVGAIPLAGCQMATEPSSSLVSTVQSGTTLTDGTLTVGVNASNTPYAGVNSSNETVGLDVDIAAALADEMGLELQIVDIESGGRSALTAGQVDVVLGMTKSGDDDTITYSSSYLSDGAALYCLEADAPESVEDVNVDEDEDKILVQGESTALYAVESALGVESVQTTSTMQEAFEALVAGDQPYLVADAVIGDYFARNYEGVVRVGFIGADSVTPIYAVTLTDNSELSAAVSNALDTITSDGTLRVIEAKWLGSQSTDLFPGQTDTEGLPSTSFGK